MTEWGFGIAGAIAAFFDVFATAVYTSYGQRPAVIGGKEVDPQWGFLPFTYPHQHDRADRRQRPLRVSSDGLPIGLHIIGPRRAEERVLRASAAFERARPWANKRPPGFE